MTLFSSLTNRIFLACALLAVATTGVAVYVVGARATHEAETELARGLADAATQVAQQQRALVARYVVFARLLADLPKLKAAVDDPEPADHRSRSRADYRRQVGADLLLVTGRSGTVLARGGDPGGDPAPDVGRAARWRATRCSSSGRTRAASCRWSRFPSPSASTSRTCSARSASACCSTSASPISSSTRRRAKWRSRSNNQVRAATLPRTSWASLLPLADKTAATSIRVADAEYVGLALPPLPSEAGMPAASGPVAATFVLQSRTERLRFLRTVETALLIAAIAAVLLATVLSYAVARTVTRPLGAITNTMREVAVTGDLTRKITLRGPAIWQDEDARLLADDLQRPDRLHRALPARGRAEGAAALARPAVHGDRARGAQPADDHQDVAALAAPGRLAAGDQGGRRATSTKRSIA